MVAALYIWLQPYIYGCSPIYMVAALYIWLHPYIYAGFPTMPEMPAIRPDEFYADLHVIGHIRLLSSW